MIITRTAVLFELKKLYSIRIDRTLSPAQFLHLVYLSNALTTTTATFAQFSMCRRAHRVSEQAFEHAGPIHLDAR